MHTTCNGDSEEQELKASRDGEREERMQGCPSLIHRHPRTSAPSPGSCCCCCCLLRALHCSPAVLACVLQAHTRPNRSQETGAVLASAALAREATSATGRLPRHRKRASHCDSRWMESRRRLAPQTRPSSSRIDWPVRRSDQQVRTVRRAEVRQDCRHDVRPCLRRQPRLSPSRTRLAVRPSKRLMASCRRSVLPVRLD